jgi:recombinational DNA repair protein (RecF pathway)
MTRRLTDVETVPIMLAAGLTPLVPYPGAHKPWLSIHECGRKVAPHYNSIRDGGRGCRHCVGQVADLTKIEAEMRAAGLKPLVPYPGSGKRWLCRHTCGREVSPRLSDIKRGRGGCGHCARNIVDPEAALAVMLDAGLTPLDPYPGSAEKWRCLHECGREVYPTHHSIKMGRGGCGNCARNIVDPEAALAVMSDAGLKPLTPYPGSNSKPWPSLHECGREVHPSYAQIRQGNGGCGFCAGNKIDPDDAMKVMLAAGLTPLDPYPGSAEKWRCFHECGREVHPSHHNVKRGQGGCEHCAGNIVDSEAARALMLASGLTPLEPYPGANKPWPCRCDTCGVGVSPTYYSIKSGGGCGFCTPGGYNSEKPGLVYLIELKNHERFSQGVIKVGIAGGNSQRLEDWKKRGWAVLESFRFEDGTVPVAIESDVLRWLHQGLGLKPCLTRKEVGHLNGHTETVSVDDLTEAGVTVTDVRKRVKQLVTKAGV